MRPRSIRGRLLLLACGLIAAALVAAWWGISALLGDFVTRRLEAELRAVARAIMAAAEWTPEGVLAIDPAPADPRFEQPHAGWYWQVEAEGRILARSPSLLGGEIQGSGRAGLGPAGAPLMTHREVFTAPGEARSLLVTVTLPAAESEAELAAIRLPLTAALAILGVTLLLAQIAAVRFGLSDLERFARAVAALGEGRTVRLLEVRAAELAPLAAELERLLAANAAQLERARAHAADLAHALKTPLAVLANRAAPEDRALIARMERMIAWHLTRARAGAAGLDPSARAKTAEVLADIALVLRPEAERRGLRLELRADAAPEFRGHAEDLAEMAGALAENAVKWARGHVRLDARGEGGRLLVEVADDGPGIPPEERARLLARGARLDEAQPGYGLGLAIAADRAAAYGGSLALAEAPEGGLLARLTLPAVPPRPGRGRSVAPG